MLEHLAVCLHLGVKGAIPILCLAKRLVQQHGFLITIIVIDDECERFVREGLRAADRALRSRIHLERLQQPPFAPAFVSLVGKLPKVKCMVADYTAGWVYDAVDHYDLPLVVFLTESALNSAFNLLLPALLGKRNKTVKTAVQDPALLLPKFNPRELSEVSESEVAACMPELTLLGLTTEQMLQHTKGWALPQYVKLAELHHYSRLACWVMVLSFEELEPVACQAFQAIFGDRLLPVGPLIVDQNSTAEGEGEDMAWLNHWPARSVLCVWDLECRREVFHALEFAKQPYVVIFQGEAREQDLKTETGRFWDCNRLSLILDHPSVGGIIITTDCWVLMLEGISRGIPLLVITQNVFYSKFIEEWKVGIVLNDVTGCSEAIEQLMRGQEGISIKQNTDKVSRLAKAAALPGGSSARNLEKIVSAIKSSTLQGVDSGRFQEMLKSGVIKSSQRRRDDTPRPTNRQEGFMRWHSHWHD